MNRIICAFSLSFLLAVGAAAQNKPVAAVDEAMSAAFKSDGCTLFPDGAYHDCCVAHDRAYFAGGSWTQRRLADKKLFKCVAAKKGLQHKIIASVMWLGVRAGGVSWLPTPFRWGFGRRKKSSI